VQGHFQDFDFVLLVTNWRFWQLTREHKITSGNNDSYNLWELLEAAFCRQCRLEKVPKWNGIKWWTLKEWAIPLCTTNTYCVNIVTYNTQFRAYANSEWVLENTFLKEILILQEGKYKYIPFGLKVQGFGSGWRI